MIHDIERLVQQYGAWLRQKTVLREVGEWVQITTPFLDRHNDYVQIYARKDDSGYTLTDDGYTIQDLRQSGCDLDTKKRRELLVTTLNGFGVQRDYDALVVHTSADSFSLHKHNLVQAILAINDLFYLATASVASLFLEDVLSWFREADIRYTPNVKFTGRSGYDHHFDLIVPASRRAPERIVQAITRPTRQAAQNFAFAWVDTRDVRGAEAVAFAMLNDSSSPPSPAVLEALDSYGVTPVPWSRRDEVVEKLAA